MLVPSWMRPAAVLLVLGACSCRPLTVNETAYLDTLYHPATARNKVDLQSIRIWSLDASRDQAVREATEQVRLEISSGEFEPRRANVTEQQLTDAIQRLVQGPTRNIGGTSSGLRGLTIGTAIYLSKYESDYSAIGQDLALLSHEVMHVWQWQNRKLTGYSLAKILREHIMFGFTDKVYDYVLVPGKLFLAYRYEQQGKIVQDYVMSGGTNQTLGRLISQALDAEQLVSAIRRLRARPPGRS